MTMKLKLSGAGGYTKVYTPEQARTFGGNESVPSLDFVPGDKFNYKLPFNPLITSKMYSRPRYYNKFYHKFWESAWWEKRDDGYDDDHHQPFDSWLCVWCGPKTASKKMVQPLFWKPPNKKQPRIVNINS